MTHANQTELSRNLIEAEPKNDGLSKKVEHDFQSGLQCGVIRMPGLFINGERQVCGPHGESRSEYIEAKIAWFTENELPFL